MQRGATRALSSEDFKHALRHWASGVTVVTTLGRDAQRLGMTVSAFSSVSAEPPVILICANRASATRDKIVERGVFAVNVLSELQEAISTQFAAAPAHERFALGEWQPAPISAVPWLEGAAANFDCKVLDQYEIGSHTIIVGAVEALRTHARDPLLYFDGHYRTLARS